MVGFLRIAIIFALVFTLTAHARVYKTKQCPGVNEKYNSCGTACPKTCEDILNSDIPKPCTLECVQGCFCRKGFVRENEESNSRCVDAEECRSSF